MAKLTKKQEKTMLETLEDFQNARKKFWEEVEKEVGKWVKKFLDYLLVCGNCKKMQRREFGSVGKCKERRYLVHHNCHACPEFDLDWNKKNGS